MHRSQIVKENIDADGLFHILDKSIDDMEAGRELTIDEAFQNITELRTIRTDNLSLSRKKAKTRALRKEIDKNLKEHKIDLCWWNKHQFVKVSTKSFDKLSLAGKYFDNNSNRTVIMVHGFGHFCL